MCIDLTLGSVRVIECRSLCDITHLLNFSSAINTVCKCDIDILNIYGIGTVVASMNRTKLDSVIRPVARDLTDNKTCRSRRSKVYIDISVDETGITARCKSSFHMSILSELFGYDTVI